MSGDVLVSCEAVGFLRSDRWILKDITWRIDKGNHWVLLGPNGCGKTTLLQMLTGTVWPTEGAITLFGYRGGEGANFPELRKHVGVVSSALITAIPSSVTGLEIVLSGPDATYRLYRDPTKKEEAEALALMERIGVTNTRDTDWLYASQGEKQRLLLCRALMAKPQLLILDEPATGLDPAAREDFLQSLQSILTHEDAPTVLLVTHHLEEIPPAIGSALLMKDGQILARGPKHGIINNEMMSELFGRPAKVTVNGGRYFLTVDESDSHLLD